MKAVFSFSGEGEFPNAPVFDLKVCFNGLPGTVVLELDRVEFQGFSGSTGDPNSEERKVTTPVLRAPLKASEARAIASAILSAATEARA